MPITLDPAAREQALVSIKRFALEELDLDLGDLKAGTVLEYFLRELAPSVYNGAIADAQRWMQDRAADLEGACHAPEFGYWTPVPKGRRGR
jgi:uncharacterized protein (DUF2164 family)